MTTHQPLQQLTVLLTRPCDQARYLHEQIVALGGRCVLFPTVVIEERLQPQDILWLQHNAASLDKILFTSTNAVYPIMPYWSVMPRSVQVFAVGKATAAALAQWEIHVQLPAQQQFSSEGLLALSQLQQVAGEHILICTGVGGKTLLADTLRHRGAQVHDIRVYARTCPHGNIARRWALWQRHGVNVVVSTSSESLRNLWEMATTPAARAWLSTQKLVVISPTVAELARRLGFCADIWVARYAGDDAILAALNTCAASM